MRAEENCTNFLFHPLLEVRGLCNLFISLSFSEIYREMNNDADALSKEGINMVEDQWFLLEDKEG